MRLQLSRLQRHNALLGVHGLDKLCLGDVWLEYSACSIKRGQLGHQICYIIDLLAFFQQHCYHHLLLLDIILLLLSLCILHIHLLVIISDMVIFILKLSVLLILIFVV